MKPNEHDLSVVNEIHASFFDAGERSADGGWEDELLGFRVGETIFWRKVVEGVDAWIEVERGFGYAGGAEEACCLDSAVGGFDASL
jgi:hypothetical protein